jgi:arylformamidase
MISNREADTMKILDISQEVFGCAVFPGDPAPERTVMMSISGGEVCNLTALKMCAHNGTHADAPYHFINDGKTIDQVDLSRFVGYAYVASHDGDLSAADAEEILRRARAASVASGITGCDAFNRILVRGKAVVTEAAAKVFADHRILLFGNESQTVGPEDAPMAVHLIMLGSEIVLLEGIRLADAKDGVYFLNAAPINLGGADGAPCRALLISF